LIYSNGKSCSLAVQKLKRKQVSLRTLKGNVSFRYASSTFRWLPVGFDGMRGLHYYQWVITERKVSIQNNEQLAYWHQAAIYKGWVIVIRLHRWKETGDCAMWVVVFRSGYQHPLKWVERLGTRTTCSRRYDHTLSPREPGPGVGDQQLMKNIIQTAMYYRAIRSKPEKYSIGVCHYHGGDCRSKTVLTLSAPRYRGRTLSLWWL
jgi:hypothetical protein